MSYKASIKVTSQITDIACLKKAVENRKAGHGFEWLGFQKNIQAGIGSRVSGYCIQHEKSRHVTVLDFGVAEEAELQVGGSAYDRLQQGIVPTVHMDQDDVHKVQSSWEYLLGPVYAAESMIASLEQSGYSVTCDYSTEGEVVYAVEM